MRFVIENSDGLFWSGKRFENDADAALRFASIRAAVIEAVACGMSLDAITVEDAPVEQEA